MQKIKDFFLKPRLEFLAPKKDEEIELCPMQMVLRGIVALVTASWIGFLPFYLFVIYMRKNKFFSYDFFVDGIFGLNTFVAATTLILIITSLYFYGFIIFAKLGIQQQKEKEKNEYRWLTWVFIIVSGFIHLYLLESLLNIGKPHLILWIMSISAIFCLFFYSFVGHGVKKNLQNWLSPVLFIAATIFLPFFFQDVTSEVIAIGLKNFNMGGEKNIKIKNTNLLFTEKTDIEGKLILLTPKNAYIKNIEKRLLIVPISEHTEVQIW